MGRLTLNLGLRMDYIRGYSPVLKETVYTPHTAWGPRLGAAVDITGNGTTVLRGFWGRYFEGTASGFFTQATPGLQDYTSTEILANGQLGATEVLVPAQVYNINTDINHPRTDEISVAWEQQLFGSMRLVATGIWRTTSDFINNVVEGALWRPMAATNPLTNQPYTQVLLAEPGRDGGELHHPQHRGLSSTRRSTDPRFTRSIRSAPTRP